MRALFFIIPLLLQSIITFGNCSHFDSIPSYNLTLHQKTSPNLKIEFNKKNNKIETTLIYSVFQESKLLNNGVYQFSQITISDSIKLPNYITDSLIHFIDSVLELRRNLQFNDTSGIFLHSPTLILNMPYSVKIDLTPSLTFESEVIGLKQKSLVNRLYSFLTRNNFLIKCQHNFLNNLPPGNYHIGDFFKIIYDPLIVEIETIGTPAEIEN